jgi:hypothetical protein
MDGNLKRVVDNLTDHDVAKAAQNKPEDAIPDGIAGWTTAEIVVYGLLSVTLASINAAISAYSDNQQFVKPFSIAAAGISTLLGLLAAVFGKTKVNNITKASAAKFRAITLAKRQIYRLKVENDALKAKSGSAPNNNGSAPSVVAPNNTHRLLGTPLLASINSSHLDNGSDSDIAMNAILEEHRNDRENNNNNDTESSRLFN